MLAVHQVSFERVEAISLMWLIFLQPVGCFLALYTQLDKQPQKGCSIRESLSEANINIIQFHLVSVGLTGLP